ncbi:MAG: photosynthetic protein synthase I [Deltaproteobacteria bacterium RBG_19FT_COMBO_60_16]|nr:MAG: photosynthetic protein synthase I [Deltaproteobacteria bacterium RBG_19FT_COMBO_60_16]
MRVRGVHGSIIAGVLLLAFLSAGDVGAAPVKYKRTKESYNVPPVTLVNQDGKKVDLQELLLRSKKPVLLDFVYATCTTICPILSVGFSNFQKELGKEAGNVALVSISIDPDNDTPPVMKEYLKRYRARPGWDFLTGKREDIIAVMKAFDSYVVNKMNHYPVTILRGPGEASWVRIYGLLGTADLMEEYRKVKGQ